MKKTFILSIVLLFAAVTTVSGQLKVSYSGKVGVGTTSTPLSNLSVNSVGNSNYSAYIDGDCKVTGGVINGNVFNPNDAYNNWTEGDMDDELVKLRRVTPKMYYQSSRADNGGEEENEEMRDGPFPFLPQHDGHYVISSSDMSQYFPLLTQQDEYNHYVVNYAELVPLLVYAYQVLFERVCELDPTCLGLLSSNDGNAEEQQGGQAQQSRSSIGQDIRLGAKLYQNTPNPFTASTVIRFDLPNDAANVYIYVFDMTGKTLKQLPVSPNDHCVTINGYELPSGMYLYSLVINGQEIDTKRMILSK